MNKRQLGGISLLLGNAAIFANGLIARLAGDTPKTREAGAGRMTSAVLWSGGGAVLARYGSQPVARQLERLRGKFASFLRKEGAVLGQDQQSLAETEANRGWFQRFEDILYNYPIECGNVYNSIAASGMIYSGFKRRGEGDYASGNGNIGTGALILAGTLGSIFIPEKTKEQIAAKGQSGTLWGKIQEQPLSYVVWLFLGSDLSQGVSAWGEYKDARDLPKESKFRPWAYLMAGISALAMVGFIVGDMLTGFSSKKVGGAPEDHEKARKILLQDAAVVLAAQPEEQRENLAKKSAEYLAKQPELRMVDSQPGRLAQEILRLSRSESFAEKRLRENLTLAAQPVAAFA